MDPLTNPAPQKARSRLKKKSESCPVLPTSTKRQRKQLPDNNTLLKKYLRFSPLLVITLVHVFAITYFMSRVDPATWKHFLIPSSYLPMLLLITSTTFFASSYLFLNTGRGVRIALLTFCIFFLKFQAVSLTIPVVFSLLCIFGFLEIVSLLKNKKADSKK